MLDNAGQGFLSFGADLKVNDEYSKECVNIFGCKIGKSLVHELILKENVQEYNIMEETLNLYFKSNEEVVKQSLLSLLPTEAVVNEKNLELSYTKILDPIDKSEQIIVIITDVTDKIYLENKVESERKILKMVVNIITQLDDFIDIKRDFIDFYEKRIDEILGSKISPRDKILKLYREIHTFKGNFGLYIIHIIPKLHQLESSLELFLEKNNEMSEERLLSFIKECDFSSWLNDDFRILEHILGADFISQYSSSFFVRIDIERIIDFEKKITPYLTEKADLALLTELRNWLHKPLKSLLKVYSEYVNDFSEKKQVLVNPLKIEGDDILVNPEYYCGFIKSLVHIFRNCIVHGIEPPDERIETGKTEYGNIRCSIFKKEKSFTLLIGDDGRGIDHRIVRKKVIERNLLDENIVYTLTDNEVIQLIFNEGFSTQDDVNEIAGRGIGLSCVKEEATKLGGTIKVTTLVEVGTTFEFEIPII